MSGHIKIPVRAVGYNRRSPINYRDDAVCVYRDRNCVGLQIMNDHHFLSATLDPVQTMRLINALLGNLNSCVAQLEQVFTKAQEDKIERALDPILGDQTKEERAKLMADVRQLAQQFKGEVDD